MSAAQNVVQSESVSAGIFAFIALALFVLSLYMAVQASLDDSYLRILRYVVAAMSLIGAVACGYETASLATHRFPTISSVTNKAFSTNSLVWVIVFVLLMSLIGALALHFTRVALPSSGVVVAQNALTGIMNPLIWAIILGIAVIVASQVVHRLTPLVVKLGTNDPGFSWWVVLLGGAVYGIGALVAWGSNWRP